MRRYVEVWRLPSAPLLIVAGIVGRLPLAVVPLALLLLVEARTGSYATAGLTTGLYAIANATVAPVLGRIADRRGPGPVLTVTGILYPVMLLTLLATLLLDAPIGLTFAAAMASGFTFPLLSSALRVLWSQLTADGPARQTAYALDAVTMETVFVLGPMVVAAVVTVMSPAAAVAGAAVVALVGSLVVAMSAPSRAWRPYRAADGRRPGSPLRARGMVLLLGAIASWMFGIGVLEVALPAFADREGSAGMAGVLLGIWAVGSAAGGIWFGSRRMVRSPVRQYQWTLLAVAVGMAPLALAGNLWVLGAVLLVGGTAIAPAMTVQSGLLAGLAPAGALTEAFTWATTVIFGANALGASVGGLTVESAVGVHGALGLAAFGAFTAWVLVALPGNRLSTGVLAREPAREPAGASA